MCDIVYNGNDLCSGEREEQKETIMIFLETQKEEFSRLKEVSIFGQQEDGEKINGDLLVVGLGGVGGKVVTQLKAMLRKEITSEDNIHYLLIDSNIPEMEDH